ncbi:MAG: hypothetical protein R3C20_15390 [Planctomycetaceae bacterium]
MVRFLPTLVLFTLVSCGNQASAEPADSRDDDFLRQVALSTVVVNGNCPASGFLIDREQRLVVTSMLSVLDKTHVWVMFPVVENGQVITEGPYYGKRLQELLIPAKVLLTDYQRRIALIQPVRLPKSAQAISPASREPRMDDPLYAIGDSTADGHLFAIFRGRLQKKLERKDGVELLATTLRTKENDWGCPVVNASCELVGMVSNAPYNSPTNDSPHIVTLSEIAAVTKKAGFDLQPKKSPEPEWMEIIVRGNSLWRQYADE